MQAKCEYDFDFDLYEVLGLDEDATKRDVRKAYRSLSLKYHPDKNSDPDAEETFKQIGIAHTILRNTGKKEKYDYFRENGCLPPDPEEKSSPFGDSDPFGPNSAFANAMNNMSNNMTNIFGGPKGTAQIPGLGQIENHPQLKGIPGLAGLSDMLAGIPAISGMGGKAVHKGRRGNMTFTTTTTNNPSDGTSFNTGPGTTTTINCNNIPGVSTKFGDNSTGKSTGKRPGRRASKKTDKSECNSDDCVTNEAEKSPLPENFKDIFVKMQEDMLANVPGAKASHFPDFDAIFDNIKK
jgi:curved DNA-binding protein CbpA